MHILLMAMVAGLAHLVLISGSSAPGASSGHQACSNFVQPPMGCVHGFARLQVHLGCNGSSSMATITTKAECAAAFRSLEKTLPEGAHDNTKCCSGDNLPSGCTYRSDNDFVFNSNMASPLTYQQYSGQAVCACTTSIDKGCSPPGPPAPPPPPPPPAELIVWAAQARAPHSKYIALINVGESDCQTGACQLNLIGFEGFEGRNVRGSEPLDRRRE